MEKKLCFMFALFLCLGVASAVTYRHDGVDTMKLDDDGNLTVNGNLKSNGATITGDLNVTGTAYLDDVTVNADNITINNIVPKDGGVVGVSGNLSTGGTGFFGWLGSLASRITALFVGDIDFSGSIKSDSGSLNLTASNGNIDSAGNITAAKFIGDGSLMTNIVAESVDNGSIDNPKIAANTVNTTQIIDGTIGADDLSADSINGTHIIDNIELRNVKVNGNLNVTKNVTIGNSKVYEVGGELIIDY